jgi:hypothetical protein
MKASERGSDEELDREYAEWQGTLRPIEVSIRRKGARDLRILKKAGADSDALVKLLAMTAKGEASWKDALRSRKERLISIARRMEKLAEDAEKQANDPSYQLDFWLGLRGGGILGMQWSPAWSEQDPGPPFIVAGMRTWSDMCKKEARRLGRYLRSFGQTEPWLALLLLYVERWTQDKGNMHFEELARLLTDAFEAAGKRRDFSAEGLKKTSKRYVPRLLRLVGIRSKLQQQRIVPPASLPAISAPKLGP